MTDSGKRTKFLVEYTDTFGGEANYSWVERRIIYMPTKFSDNQLVREAKKSLGLTGVPFRRADVGGDIVLRENNACRILFIIPVESDYLI